MKVRVTLLHQTTIPDSRWCDPVGWQPSNEIAGSVYMPGTPQLAGSWWNDGTNTAGIVWFGKGCTGQVIDVDLDDLRVFSCGSDFRELGKVHVNMKDIPMTNLPAFPTNADAGNCDGLSIRQYFAAHAPADPQPWFKPTMPNIRPPAEFGEQSRQEEPINIDAIMQWDDERQRQRYIQWPWAWADAVLAARQATLESDLAKNIKTLSEFLALVPQDALRGTLKKVASSPESIDSLRQLIEDASPVVIFQDEE